MILDMYLVLTLKENVIYVQMNKYVRENRVF
jgi:hypothetical protein